MSNGMALGSRDQRKMLDLAHALGASLDLQSVCKDAFRLLLPLIGADYGALATSRSERADDYEWIVQDLPPAFLGSYHEMAPHDFVRGAVLSKINMVVRDSEMIDRRTLERNMMYHRARYVGSPLEQVMAVMLHVGSGFQSGLSLYRAKRRPFTEREQRILQLLTRPIADAVRNCRLFAKMERMNRVFEALLASRKDAVILVRPPAQEIDRTAPATALLDAWFGSAGRGLGVLPHELTEELANAQAARARGQAGPWTRTLDRGAAVLEVEILPLPEHAGDSLWMIKLREVPHLPAVPPSWQARLTPSQCEVVSRILRGWNYDVIAQDLSCSPNTVKKHAQNIFDRLGVEDRKKLHSLYLKVRDA